MARTQAEQDVEAAAARAKAKKKSLFFSSYDNEDLRKSASTYGLEALEKGAINTVAAIRNGEELVQLSFPEDPTTQNYVGLYKPKVGLIPDHLLKLLSRQDDLVASILHARSNQISAFGRELQDRFSTGFRIEPRRGVTEDMEDSAREQLLDRIERVSKLLSTCGHVSGFPIERQTSLATFMYLQARNGVLFGRFATEIIYVKDNDGKDKPHSFRAVDAGTIYQAQPREGQRGDAVRKDAMRLLEKFYGRRLQPDKIEKGDYTWYQVINGIPRQGYESQELCVHNLYPTTDLELGGYPLTPLDTVMAAVTTHINITTHNKLYFQNGRAARGMVVIRSDDNDQDYVDAIRQHFQATATGVEKSFRIPVFGLGKEDEMQWIPIELQAGRDAEFQYLTDSNARVILSAFQMSPEELPGYQHLARGTNNMALSECLDPSTSMVFTPDGLRSLGSILGESTEAGLMLWNGTAWREARVFRTGDKKLVETQAGPLKIRTSPDHRFLTLDIHGQETWKQQRELIVGDYVFINAKPMVGNVDSVPSFRGNRLSSDMLEILGWLTGDGVIVDRRNVGGAKVQWFYHSEKEREIWQQQAKALGAFGLNVKSVEREVTQAEADSIKARYGFRSVAKTRLTNTVYGNEFCDFLFSLGFTPSADGKSVPASLYAWPVEYRRAFLRGLFSADGHAPKNGSVVLTIQNKDLREQVRQLLVGLGIRTLACRGIVRESFGKKAFSGKIFIRDRNAFWDQIGFLQPHKAVRRREEKWVLDSLPEFAMRALARQCVETQAFSGLGKRSRDNLKSVADGKRRGSVSYLQRSFEACGLSLPSWMLDHHLEKVTEISDLNQNIEMVDVEIFDSEHKFVTNGFIVHNSNNEWKLEAARDIGIRPLLSSFQDFLNTRILPLFDADVAKYCTLKLYGLDADSPEREATRLQQDSALHMVFNDVLERVEKDPLPPILGGSFPLNPGFQAVVQNYLSFGEILEGFFDKKGASKDPAFAFYQNQFWMSYQQMLMQQQQMQQQAQAQQQQAQAQQQQQMQQAQQPAEGGDDISKGADQALDALGHGEKSDAETTQKAEAQLTPQAKALLGRHRHIMKTTLEGWHRESRESLAKILAVVKKTD